MSQLVYLASRYSRIDEMNHYAALFRAGGYRVEARWLAGEHQVHDAAEDDVPDIGELFAGDDIEDLEAADIVVCFTEKPRAQLSTRGGRHVEFGYALAKGKRILVVGPRENVFYCLLQVERFADWDDLMRRAGLFEQVPA